MAEPKPNMDVLWSETGEIITPPTTKVEEGWVSEKPPYQTFNWLLNRSDRFLKHIDEQGLPEWSAGVTYGTGALAMYNGSVCESLQDSNTGNVPGTAGWWNVGTYVKRFGDTMEDKLTIVSTTDETLDLQSRNVGETVSTRLLDSNGEPLVTISSNDTNRNAVVEVHDANGNVTGSFTLAEPGRIAVSSSGISNDDELTRKDYVDTSIKKTSSSKIISVSGTVDGSSLTVTLDPVTLDFRDVVSSSGKSVSVITSVPLTMSISSGSTLGTVDGIKSKIVLVAINNEGTIELACINIAGGVNLDESILINTVAEGGVGGADLDNVFYSTISRSGVAFRVVGYVESTQAVAGTWDTAPSVVQGSGGQAMLSLQGIGHNQTIKDVVGSRALNVTYYNTTGRPIYCSVTTSNGASAVVTSILIDGVQVTSGAGGGSDIVQNTVIIPKGSSYLATTLTNGVLVAWEELR